ncbi:MAG: DUF3035 domain-containing protein [Emcibacteraceae bacterium]|jgi:hypothetical protein|nr:DUF3035 domain-containing protein [Emcibacteraceae bacterium]MDG1727159.1 DUF3035 domain-containing protein [Emcibacteraceae bacterium]
MRNNILIFAITVMTLGLLSGCSGKSSPDEFLILKNAPLSMPPDYHLTPSGPTSDIDEVVDPKIIAQRALFGVEQ